MMFHFGIDTGDFDQTDIIDENVVNSRDDEMGYFYGPEPKSVIFYVGLLALGYVVINALSRGKT